MSSTPVAELEAGLVAMQALKPPGVSGSRIKDITALCVANIQVCFLLLHQAPAVMRLRGFVATRCIHKCLNYVRAQVLTSSARAPP